MFPDTPFSRLRALVASDSVKKTLNMAEGKISLVCALEEDRQQFSSETKGEFSADTPVEVSCIAKNMTALLFAMAVAEGLVAYEDPVARFFGPSGSVNPSLRVFHLLNCSHGLDGSSIDAIPYTRDGQIDTDVLWATMSEDPPISPPGEHFYYYGSVGLWLAAAILEKLYLTSFSCLLKEKLLRRIDAEARITDASRICPATGGLEMSANELLRLCCFHLADHRDAALTRALHLLRACFHLRLPVWMLAGDSSGPGWFGYVGASFGHFARTSTTSSFILVSPAAKSAMAITALGGRTAFMAQPTVTGQLLSVRDLSRPRLMTAEQRSSLPVERIVGLYCKSRLALEITCYAPGKFRASVYSRVRRHLDRTPILVTDLLPKAEDTFFAANPEVDLIPYLKLGGATSDCRFTHAFTGKHTFLRA